MISNNKVVKDRYMDNDKDYAFECALQELEEELFIQQLEECQAKVDIGNPMKLYGAI